ncbi:hypothetical protein DV738_g2845, partial [Chaetothyriales sp. CBS 135597]
MALSTFFKAILVNGSYPGPALKLKVGECVDFVVINNLEVSTAVHFHGIRQKDTPYADGAAGLTQYPIPAGESYQYRWTADASGVYFYHAHYKGQVMDGLIGAIIIQAADDAVKPFDQISGVTPQDVEQLLAAETAVEPVFVSDWSRFTFDEFFAIEQAANIDSSCSDSFILNGHGAVYCPSAEFIAANSAPQVPVILNGSSLTAKGCMPPNNAIIQGARYNRTISAIPPGMYEVCTPTTGDNYTHTVDPSNGWAAFSFINSGGLALFRVSIDSHKLYVYEYNGNYITPQRVDQVNLLHGDRISFAVKLDQPAGNYQIRVANLGINQVISGFGVLSYAGAGTTALTGTPVFNYGGFNSTPIAIFNAARASPFPPESPAPTADRSFVFDLQKAPELPFSWAWTMNVEPYDHSLDDAEPLLFRDPASIPESELVLKTNTGEWVDLIIKVAGPLAQPHSIHKHANKFFVIGAGVGPFNFNSTEEAIAAGLKFNLDTPPYVDGYTSTPAERNSSWMVFRYQVNTPGTDSSSGASYSDVASSGIALYTDGSSSDTDPSATSSAGIALYTGAASSVVITQSTTLFGLVAAFLVLFV